MRASVIRVGQSGSSQLRGALRESSVTKLSPEGQRARPTGRVHRLRSLPGRTSPLVRTW